MIGLACAQEQESDYATSLKRQRHPRSTCAAWRRAGGDCRRSRAAGSNGSRSRRRSGALLLAVERIVGRAEIEHNARWRLGIGLHKHVDGEPLDGALVVIELLDGGRGRSCRRAPGGRASTSRRVRRPACRARRSARDRGAARTWPEKKVCTPRTGNDTAATIIIAIFLLVLAVEQLSNWVRRRII